MIKFLLILLSLYSVIYSQSIKEISINQGRFSSELVVSLENVNLEKLNVIKLSNPSRVYFDIDNSDKNKFLSFTRRFSGSNSAISELRVWHHKKIAEKNNVYRVAVEFNSEVISNYKIVKKSNKQLHIFFYPKNSMKLNSFEWSSTQIKKIMNVASDDFKNQNNFSVSLIGVDYQLFKELGNIKFTFNGKLPKYEYKLSENKRNLLLKFNSNYKLMNKEVSRVFSEKSGVIKNIKFLGQDENEQAIFSLTFRDEFKNNNIIMEESLNGLSLSFLNYNNVNKNIAFVELNSMWEKILKNDHFNLVEKVYAKDNKIKNQIPKKIRIISSQAILRKDSKPYSKILGKLSKGMRFNIIKFENGYFKVKNRKTIGYVFKSYTDASIYKKEVKNSAINTLNTNVKKIKKEVKKEVVNLGKISTNKKGIKFFKVKVSNLRLRETASTRGKVKKTLPINTKIIVIKKKKKWAYIELVNNKNQKGWVASKMIKLDDSMKDIGKKSIVVMNKKIKDTLTVIPNENKISFHRNKELGPFIPRYKENAEDDSAPNLAFLSLVGIIYDEYDKIALFESRDKATSKTIFTMREGDKVKSGKLYKIEKDKVVFLMTMFGITKTQILKIEKKDN